MKSIIKKVGIVMGVLLFATQITSCKKTVVVKKEKIATVKKTATKVKKIIYQKPVVFITGIDKKGEQYYTNARAYFLEKKYQVIDNAYSLEEIIVWLNTHANQKLYSEIHIVSKNNPWKGLDLETVINGEKITKKTLQINLTQGKIPTLENVVTNTTKIVFHANALAKNESLINMLKEVFMANETPKLVSTPYYTIFDGAFKKHYLAQPFYVFYPTAHSPGKTDLSKEIAKKYPEEKEIDWFEALNNEIERYVGEPYTIQFMIPIQWTFDYHNSDDEIPTLNSKEEIMDWIEQNEDLNKEITTLNIPIEKFRWKASVKNSQLTIKGRTSVLCVLKPVLKPYGDLEYVEPDTNNKRLFAMK